MIYLVFFFFLVFYYLINFGLFCGSAGCIGLMFTCPFVCRYFLISSFVFCGLAIGFV